MAKARRAPACRSCLKSFLSGYVNRLPLKHFEEPNTQNYFAEGQQTLGLHVGVRHLILDCTGNSPLRGGNPSSLERHPGDAWRHQHHKTIPTPSLPPFHFPYLGPLIGERRRHAPPGLPPAPQQPVAPQARCTVEPRWLRPAAHVGCNSFGSGMSEALVVGGTSDEKTIPRRGPRCFGLTESYSI